MLYDRNLQLLSHKMGNFLVWYNYRVVIYNSRAFTYVIGHRLHGQNKISLKISTRAVACCWKYTT